MNPDPDRKNSLTRTLRTGLAAYAQDDYGGAFRQLDKAAQAGIGVRSLSVQSTSLDDVFVHYTGRALRDALQEASPKDSPMMMKR